MQIHELNKKSQKLNEVDLFGPNSIYNVGKQVLKNPAALTKSSALGAAQQAANQASADSSAQELIKQGYKVGGGIKPTVTAAQQLQTVKNNPAVQRQVQNLTSQWMAQSAALKKSNTITEAAAVFDPRDVTDPKYADALRIAMARDDAARGVSTPQPSTTSPDAQKKIELEKQLTTFKTQFKTWSDPRLQASGITIDEVRKKPETEQMIDSALSNVAVAMNSGDENLEKQAVEEYFNIAIAAIQAHVQNTGQRQTPTATGAATTPGAASDEEQQILKQLEGLGITKTSLGTLGKLMSQSAQGGSTINDTGNPLLNTIAKLAGMNIK